MPNALCALKILKKIKMDPRAVIYSSQNPEDKYLDALFFYR